MKPKKPPKTLGIFIDGSNFYHDLQRLGVKRIDYQKLLEYLAGPNGVFIQNWFFAGTPKPKKNDQPEKIKQKINDFTGFKKYLETLGFEVVTRNVKHIYNKSTGEYVGPKCDLDPEIKDTIKEIVEQQVGIPEKIYFLSGDSDFEDSVKLLQKACRTCWVTGKKIALETKVIVVSSWESLSYELRNQANGIIDLRHIVKRINQSEDRN